MFNEINPEIFADPEFKEDSVRELVIAPLIAKLGYKPSGDIKVTRSKSLENPFIRVGRRNHPVITIPDYTFYIDNKVYFVLDAKGPCEEITSAEHVQQAYSYAIHPEIKCSEFGLCNGRELVIFNTHQIEPLLHLKFEDFEAQWSEIEKYLSPKFLAKPALRNFAPDFGTALKRLGINSDTDLIFHGVKLGMFAKINSELMTATANCEFGTEEHCVSFDFHTDLLDEILSGIPERLRNLFSKALDQAPFQASAGLAIELDLTAKIGKETQGQSETFFPLLIQEIHDSRFNPLDVPEQPDDIPSHIFKLRNAYKIINV